MPPIVAPQMPNAIAAVPAAEVGVEDRLRRRQDHGAADALEDAGQDQQLARGCRAGEGGRGSEHDEADDVQRPPTEEVADAPQRDQQRREDQGVDRVDPLGGGRVDPRSLMIDGTATLTMVASTMIIATPRLSMLRPSHRPRPASCMAPPPAAVVACSTRAVLPSSGSDPVRRGTGAATVRAVWRGGWPECCTGRTDRAGTSRAHRLAGVRRRDELSRALPPGRRCPQPGPQATARPCRARPARGHGAAVPDPPPAPPGTRPCRPRSAAGAGRRRSGPPPRRATR